MKVLKIATVMSAILILLISVCAEALVWTPPTDDSETGAPRVITKFSAWNPYTYALAVEAGQTTEEEIIKKLDLTNCFVNGFDSSGKSRRCYIKWKASSADMTKPGVFKIMGEPSMEGGCSIAPGTEIPKVFMPISIQEKYKPQINVFHTARSGTFTFPWVSPPCAPEEMTIWISEDEGEWIALEHDDYVFVFKSNMVLDSSLLKNGSSYRLRADYTGGHTNTLFFKFDRTIIEAGFIDGDRDTGDLNQPDPPAIEPPSDEKVTGGHGGGRRDTGAESSSSAEFSTPYSASYSGRRIDLMRNEKGGINISRSEFDLEIPKETLDAIGIGKNDTLSVSVRRGESGEINVNIAKNGRSTDTAGALTLTLPYSGEEPPLLLSDTGTAPIRGISGSDTVSYAINGAGTYRAAGKDVRPSEKKNADSDKDWKDSGTLAVTVCSAAAYIVRRKFLI